MSSKNKLIFIGLLFIMLIVTSLLLFIVPKVEIKLHGETNIKINVGDKYDEYGASAQLIGIGIKKEIPVEIKGKVDTSLPGKYLVTYHANYKKRSYDAIRTVNVADMEKPELTVNSKVTICRKNNLVNIDAKAIDNFDGDITENIKYKIVKSNIILYVEDSSNNKAEYTQELVYNDDKPKITLNGSSTIYLNVGEKYTEYGATASDTCDGNLSKNISVTGNVDSNIVGEYVINYKVSDLDGNSVSIDRKIYVQEKVEENVIQNGVVYLTFDDGPGPYTEQILDILKSNNIKATFFVTNQLGDKYQYLIKKEYEAGHTVGIHTYSHKWSIYDSVDSYLNDFEKIRKIVVDQTGMEPKYFRFPGGTSNHVAKISMKELANMMIEKGYVYFDWHIDCGDTHKNNTKAYIVNMVKKHLKSNQNNIILMHDIKKNTLNALPEIIEYAKSKGYVFKAIDDTTPLKQFAPHN